MGYKLVTTRSQTTLILRPVLFYHIVNVKRRITHFQNKEAVHCTRLSLYHDDDYDNDIIIRKTCP